MIINRRSLIKNVIFDKLLNNINDDNANITNLILDSIFNNSLLIEILNESKLIINFNNFVFIINYNSISRAKDLNNIFINILFIESRVIIKSDNSSIANNNNKKLVKNLNSSSNSF